MHVGRGGEMYACGKGMEKLRCSWGEVVRCKERGHIFRFPFDCCR